jgi:predicted PurR-regulated permease PerM
MTRIQRISYGIMAVLLVLVACFHLGTLLLTALFGYFALQKLSFGGHRFVGVGLYLVLVAALGSGFYTFSRHAYVTLPKIADSTIPAVVNYAQAKGVELPFTDYPSLRAAALKAAKEKVANIGRYVTAAVFQLALLVIGLVVALSLFLNVRWGADEDPRVARDSLYAGVVRELTTQFETFYGSFARVIGAQIIISAINTTLTAVFLLWNGFPYAFVLIGLTFLFGLIPIIGNICSNTLIVGVGFTLSPKMALLALIFLIVIHKLEYFVNSKIIGARTKNPMWLTMIALVLGEELMGVAGMVLAPVVLHYIRNESSKRKESE